MHTLRTRASAGRQAAGGDAGPLLQALFLGAHKSWAVPCILNPAGSAATRHARRQRRCPRNHPLNHPIESLRHAHTMTGLPPQAAVVPLELRLSVRTIAAVVFGQPRLHWGSRGQFVLRQQGLFPILWTTRLARRRDARLGLWPRCSACRNVSASTRATANVRSWW